MQFSAKCSFTEHTKIRQHGFNKKLIFNELEIFSLVQLTWYLRNGRSCFINGGRDPIKILDNF